MSHPLQSLNIHVNKKKVIYRNHFIERGQERAAIR